jgi:hypothetical protein
VRRPIRRIGKRREEYFAVAQAAVLEAKHRKSIGNPGEERLSPKATGNERFVGNPEVILGPDLFGGRVINALLFGVG